MNTIPTVSQITDNAFALAVAVFRECVASLSQDDKQDVLSLMPQLLNGDDDEERQSAVAAITNALRSDDDVAVRETAAWALGEIADRADVAANYGNA